MLFVILRKNEKGETLTVYSFQQLHSPSSHPSGSPSEFPHILQIDTISNVQIVLILGIISEERKRGR